MRLLLDTHALLWAFLDSPRLSAAARAAIASPENEKLVSAVSAMEVTLKHRRGRLDEAAPFIRDGRMVLEGLDYTPLPIGFDHASLAGSLDIAHKDPFDRLLIAQARIERVPIVSNKKLFDDFGVRRLW
ncbi:MAG TPA: type II toxin-antitoxin system VapC family toxin [Allosphingosinicella sp.]|nr:type II toxin-antitoxin system VapC family toxin [Allosphingosinicella sp.]